MGLNRAIYARKHGYKRVPKGAFYHSSWLAGSELLCAGCITVVKAPKSVIFRVGVCLGVWRRL